MGFQKDQKKKRGIEKKNKLRFGRLTGNKKQKKGLLKKRGPYGVKRSEAGHRVRMAEMPGTTRRHGRGE